MSKCPLGKPQSAGQFSSPGELQTLDLVVWKLSSRGRFWVHLGTNLDGFGGAQDDFIVLLGDP